MNKKQKMVYGITFAVALIFYFTSEQILRSITVSSMSKKMDTSLIISKLPSAIRDAVNHKIAVTTAENDLVKASTDLGRVNAMNRLAILSESTEGKDTYYGAIIAKYTSLVESYAAHRHYFFEKDKDATITILEYQKFIKILKPIDQYSAWFSGLSKLEKNKATISEIISFVKPLLELKPQYRDYYELYSKVSTYSINAKNDAMYNKAEQLKRDCLDLKLIEEVLAEIEEKTNPKKKRRKKKKKSRKKKPTSRTNTKGAQK